MSQYRITSRYAKALLDLGLETKKLDEIYEDVSALVTICDQNRGLVVLFKNPIVLPQKKLSVIDHLFKGKIEDVTFKFLEVIIRKNRSRFLFETLEQFVITYKSFKGIAGAELTTAYEANQDTKDRVSAILEKASGENIELKTKVNEELIGGFTIRYKDRLIDASVANKLKALKKELID